LRRAQDGYTLFPAHSAIAQAVDQFGTRFINGDHLFVPLVGPQDK
jgi:hypothetical protein